MTGVTQRWGAESHRYTRLLFDTLFNFYLCPQHRYISPHWTQIYYRLLELLACTGQYDCCSTLTLWLNSTTPLRQLPYDWKSRSLPHKSWVQASSLESSLAKRPELGCCLISIIQLEGRQGLNFSRGKIRPSAKYPSLDSPSGGVGTNTLLRVMTSSLAEVENSKNLLQAHVKPTPVPRTSL
jgi:hypothetical protein